MLILKIGCYEIHFFLLMCVSKLPVGCSEAGKIKAETSHCCLAVVTHGHHQA
jgi:hypothetical protein